VLVKKKKAKTKLCGLSPRANCTDRAPPVGEVNANFCGERAPCGQRDGSIRSYSLISRQETLLSLLSSSSIVLPRLSDLSS
jgi:hypothetical protein